MQGRVFGIKKSTILKFSGWVNLSLIIFFVLFSIFFMRNYYLWFFVFCFFIGVHCLIKSLLFRLDSSCFLGFLLLLIGVAGFSCYYFNLEHKYFYFLIACGTASLITFLFTLQLYQLLTGIFISVTSILSFLFSSHTINLVIFLVTILSFSFIFFLVCVILLTRYKKNK